MYKVKFNNHDIELPEYSVEIASDIQELDNVEGDINTKFRALYDFIVSVIGSDKTLEVLKTFDKADPNMINILFLSIVEEYNKPLKEYQMKESLKSLGALDDPQIKQSLETIDKIVKAKAKDND